MKKKSLILSFVAAAIALAPIAKAQTTEPPPSPQQTFFDSTFKYFTAFNTNLDIGANKVEVWTAVQYQQNVDVANTLAADFSFKKGGGIYFEGGMDNAGIAGTILNLRGGLGWAFIKYDTRLSIGANGGYDLDIEKPIAEFYVDIRKALTENTFSGLRLGYQTTFVNSKAAHVPTVSVEVGFGF